MQRNDKISVVATIDRKPYITCVVRGAVCTCMYAKDVWNRHSAFYSYAISVWGDCRDEQTGEYISELGTSKAERESECGTNPMDMWWCIDRLQLQIKLRLKCMQIILIQVMRAGKCKLIKNNDANRNCDSKSVFNNVYEWCFWAKYGFAISKWILNVHKGCFWKCTKFDFPTLHFKPFVNCS